MKVLFLNPPSFGRFDSAGARFAGSRKTSSLWYPAWLGYAAAITPNSTLIDCPATNITLSQLLRKIKEYDLIVIYTSTPSFQNDIDVATAIKKKNLKNKIIFVGPHVSVLPQETLLSSKAIDGVARKEFDTTIFEVASGKAWNKIRGLSYRSGRKIIHNQDHPLLMDLNSLPFVSPIYKRDLDIYKYHLPFCLYPYIAIYAGRGCPNMCTFCLWPQTFTGRIYRKRTVNNVIREVKWIKNNMPEIKEIFFDDDTFTINNNWVLDFCKKIKPLNIFWSVNARANVPKKTLVKMKESGCRFLIVGYESGNSSILKNIKKGVTSSQAKKFTAEAKKAGLMVHGTFVLGLPGETKETIQNTFRYACNLDCDTIQVSIATAFPGTEFYNFLVEKRFLLKEAKVDNSGYQVPTVSYPNLTGQQIQKEVEKFHLKYYFRPKYFLKTLRRALISFDEAKRIAISSYEFGIYLIKNMYLLFS
jgi:hopanoid biosynthesis associated radical SAM protein HpnJ